MTRKINCMNCMVGRFKDDLCDEKMCEALKRVGNSDDFVDIIMLAKEIVKCKDCYHAVVDDLLDDDITHMFCVYLRHKVDEDDYCSFGEHKGGDSE